MMGLDPGTRLGPYEITALLGAGGMGEVYRARDTRLERTVALKVLLAQGAADPDRRRRFEQEARAVSALNHPHICTLHDIGSAGGTDYLVMECLEGETLAERLARGPLPLPEVLARGGETAAALAAAHQRGIIHRDLKPGNVMLTAHGAKLLDFGLARLTQRPAASGESQTLSAPGAIAGTVPYMAPEQLEGKAIDARTDVFAFGVVLYEMLTGTRPFSGESQAAVVAAILGREPAAVSSLAPITPPALDRLIHKCLAKSPDARWQSAADVADELRWIASGSGTGAAAGAVSRPATRRRRRWPWAAATGVLVLCGAAAGWWAWRDRFSTPPPAIQASHRQVTLSGDVVHAALSPDGRSVAYAVERSQDDVRVLVRDVSGGEGLEIWKGTGTSAVRWMPDNTRIVISGQNGSFDRPGHVWLVPRFSGEPKLLGRLGTLVAPSPDGQWLVVTSGRNTVTAIPLGGGDRRSFAIDGVRWIHQIRLNSRGSRVAVVCQDNDNRVSVRTVSLEGQGPRLLYADSFTGEGLAGAFTGLSVCWAPAGDHLYLQRLRNGTTDLVRLSDAEGEAMPPKPLLAGMPAASSCDLSSDGRRLLQMREVSYSNLWRLDLSRSSRGFALLTHSTSRLVGPTISGEGESVLATRVVGSRLDTVRVPSTGGDPASIAEGDTRWSPDGREALLIDPSWRVWIGDANNQNRREITGVTPAAWFWPDGRLAWQTADGREIRLRDLRSGQEASLVDDPSVGFILDARLSPKRDRIAVSWKRKDGNGLWILSWPGKEARFLARDVYAVGWSPEGRWVYGHRASELVRVEADTGDVDILAPLPRGTKAQEAMACDTSRDSQFIVCALDERKADAWLVENFDPQAVGAAR
jgi:WD40 repeat protein